MWFKLQEFLSDSSKLQRIYKWLLFLTFFATIPCLYIMIVVGGFVPAQYFFLDPIFQYLGRPAMGRSWDYIVYALFTFPAGLIFGGIEYWVAAFSARHLVKLPNRFSLAIVGITVALCVALSSMEIYLPLSHNGSTHRNILSLYRQRQ